jgi:hypothetical protein
MSRAVRLSNYEIRDFALDEAIARAGHPLAKARTSWP